MHLFTHMDIWEGVMLICFGASWPFALYKTYKSKSVRGKSLRFSGLVILGYIFGVIHKIVYSPDAVIFLYLLNIAFVSIDVILIMLYKNRPQSILQTEEDTTI